jgi:radical SAM protein (TIGR04043 family)
MLISDSLANVPVFGFATNSPLELTESERGHHVIDGQDEIPVELINSPDFHDQQVSDGTPMKKIALAHGNECLASTIHQRCIRWRNQEQCLFCGIELSADHGTTVERKRPDQLAEVALAAEKDGFRHVTLTTGTPNLRDKGSEPLARAAAAIKEGTRMQVHVQVEPVERDLIELMHSEGADSVGIHIESLDRAALARTCPGKASDWDSYFESWGHAVEVFGSDQVSSYVILGLGERRTDTMAGIERMCEEGVIPFIVPLRPLEETGLHGAIPPPPEVMEEYYEFACRQMKEHGMDPRRNLAGCVRCGGCSALTDYYGR